MNWNNLTFQNARPVVYGLFLLGLWFSLFLSLQSGDIRNIGHPGINYSFLQGIRAALPLTAAFLAVVLIVIKMRHQRPEKFLYLGPLGLTAAYGVVGMVASTLSPRGLDSLYWSVSYMSVPLVLWAIVWRPSPFEWIERLILLNWVVVLLAVAALFAFGLIYLNLGNFIFSPSEWLDCGLHPWYDKSSHYIRSTGVGRYAALAGIISLTRFWHPKWRTLWTLLFLVSMVLLLFSGARTSMAGFFVAASLVFVISSGKRTAFGLLMVGAVLTPVFWTTGIHNDFLDACIFRRLPAKISSEPPSAKSIGIPSPSLSVSSDLLPLVKPVTILKERDSDEVDVLGVVTVLKERDSDEVDVLGVVTVPRELFTFTGRTQVWRKALDLTMESPILGYGFQADRYLLNTHAHNSVIHSLLQAGILGTIPFIGGLLLAWLLLLKASLNRSLFSQNQKSLFIQVSGMVAFLSVRSFTESTGAFFGVDWLLLGPILLYLQAINFRSVMQPQVATTRRLWGLIP